MVEKLLPPLMRVDPLHLTKLLWRHRQKLPPLYTKLREVLKDSQENKSRSLSEDLEYLNNQFETQIKIQGVDNIPVQGGVVLVTSHVVSQESAPGWINENVNPFWWASGIAQGVKSVRDDEIRPITYSSGKEGGLHRKIIEILYGGFPVSHRKKDKALNRAQTRAAKKLVDEGGIVLIAPEGENRTGLTEPHLGGISRLLGKNIPFVPVAYFEEQVGNEFEYTVCFGEPLVCEFSLPEPVTDKEPLPLTDDLRKQVAEFVDRLMLRIAKMLPTTKQGLYQERLNS